jgi:hypothetical protein
VEHLHLPLLLFLLLLHRLLLLVGVPGGIQPGAAAAASATDWGVDRWEGASGPSKKRIRGLHHLRGITWS